MAWVSDAPERATAFLDLLLGYSVAGVLLGLAGVLEDQPAFTTTAILGGIFSALFFYYKPIEWGVSLLALPLAKKKWPDELGDAPPKSFKRAYESRLARGSRNSLMTALYLLASSLILFTFPPSPLKADLTILGYRTELTWWLLAGSILVSAKALWDSRGFLTRMKTVALYYASDAALHRRRLGLRVESGIPVWLDQAFQLLSEARDLLLTRDWPEAEERLEMLLSIENVKTLIRGGWA